MALELLRLGPQKLYLNPRAVWARLVLNSRPGPLPRPLGRNMPNDESPDIFVAVDDILKRIDCTTLATLSPDYHQVARQRYAALCNGMAKRKRRERKVTLASVAKQANKAGIAVARYEIEPDGKIIVVTGKPDDYTASIRGSPSWTR